MNKCAVLNIIIIQKVIGIKKKYYKNDSVRVRRAKKETRTLIIRVRAKSCDVRHLVPLLAHHHDSFRSILPNLGIWSVVAQPFLTPLTMRI